ncbi:toll-like receptor 4 [Mytilus californianus]|uniref:toll-like receptor 4 n=1 Tax=Mytilus californianus TaxID=6549 RepID=UPI002245F093|nr:toll-like receptor 4 [Mytilus californianus]
MVITQLFRFLVCFVLTMGVNGHLKTKCSVNHKCRCKTSGTKYVEVDCSHSKLKNIPKLPRNVSSVDLSNNDIDNIPEHHFKDNDILTEINLSLNKLHTLKKEMFYGLKRVRKLDMNNNNLTKTTKDAFSYLQRLSYLDVKKNNISWSNNNVIFPQSLLTLKIDYNSSEENLPEMSHLEILDVSGSSGHCHIHTVKPDTFRSVPKIYGLDISACKVNYVHNGSFSFMRNLSTLDISFNTCLRFDGLENVTIDLPFTSIKILKFNKIHKTFQMNTKILKHHLSHLRYTNLEEMHGDSNRIQLIEDGAIQQLPSSIRKLFVSDNEFSYGQYVFDFITMQIEFVNASFLFSSRRENEREEKCERPDESCCNKFCKPIHTSDETISRFSAAWRVLPIPRKLKRVLYKDCFLRYEIPQYTVSENIVEYVDLSYNIFYSWIGPLLTFDHVQFLDLSNNICSNVSKAFFKSVPNVITLLIQNNLLGFVLPDDTEGEIMQHMPALQIVNLAENRIPSLPYIFFKFQANLKDIILAGNMMDNITFQINHMKQLSNLDLSNNRISSLDKNARGHLEEVYKMKDKFSIDISGNPLKCSCDTIEFIKWMSTTKIKIHNKHKTSCLTSQGNRESLWKPNRVFEKLQMECSSYSSLIVGTVASLIVFLFVLIWGIVYRNRWRLRYMYYMVKNKYQVQNKGNPANDSQYEYDAFISYDNNDRFFVHDKLLPCLEHKAGLKLCIHKRDFLPGNDIAGNITSAIHNSRQVVIMMSHNYLDSYWCMFEYNMAKVETIYSRNKENILFLVFLEQMSPKDLPMMVLELVQSHSYIEYPNDEFGDTVFWNKLREVLSQ